MGGRKRAPTAAHSWLSTDPKSFRAPVAGAGKTGHLKAVGLAGNLLLRNQYKTRLNNLEREAGEPEPLL